MGRWEVYRLNNRGQFSIIAALFVAVVLITTVIMTYSTIRTSPVQTQPQVLSAIDETNLALKQILSFTVGYYGSVLQVTGNTSYARTLATDYLYSGLENIADMHPEWGTSFNLINLELETNWYTRTSYSRGNLDVTYNLTGLGIYGITYATSSKLSVQVVNVSATQANIVITKDEDEPLVNLGTGNFKFYRYQYANSTWQLINPTIEPMAFANGTYLINIPSGVDPYSYTVQVEDQRGILVVTSSFNHYVLSLAWNQQSPTKYAVTGTSSTTLGAPDKNYATIVKGNATQVTDYQGGTGVIRKVYFNITYYGGPASGTLEWDYQLDGGAWNKIEDLPEGGTSATPLTRTYNATGLRASWTWSNLNTTNIQFKNVFSSSTNAYVDAMYVTLVYDVAGDYSTISNATLVGELLQNGTLRWLGQNLQLTTTAKPIPPVPVKSVHVNQTINGADREVPFQIEDWSSEYRVPLGLTNNASVFNSRTMLVFLADSRVSKVTVWWNGSDAATQTPYAYVNRYFTGDNPSGGVLTNGIVTLNVITSGGSFKITSTYRSTSDTAEFMRVNNQWSTYGASPAYVIHHGIVRDIIQQEAEFSGGVTNSPNFYSHIVLTLPANVTYYTYQLRLMFVDSTQSRTIKDLLPIRLTVSTGSPMTENGTSSSFPTVRNGTGTFYNYSSSVWAHHWTQMWASGNKGAGIMFTSSANQRLYAFDTIAGSTTGALGVYSSNRTIHLLPITRFQTQFTYALDLTWYGAVVTFDNSRPIYTANGGTKTGWWITVEYPPTVTVTTEG